MIVAPMTITAIPIMVKKMKMKIVNVGSSSILLERTPIIVRITTDRPIENNMVPKKTKSIPVNIETPF